MPRTPAHLALAGQLVDTAVSLGQHRHRHSTAAIDGLDEVPTPVVEGQAAAFAGQQAVARGRGVVRLEKAALGVLKLTRQAPALGELRRGTRKSWRAPGGFRLTRQAGAG